jgi:hypothetical protein
MASVDELARPVRVRAPLPKLLVGLASLHDSLAIVTNKFDALALIGQLTICFFVIERLDDNRVTGIFAGALRMGALAALVRVRLAGQDPAGEQEIFLSLKVETIKKGNQR